MGRTPPFTRRQRRVFWIASTAGFFDQYDRALLSLALKQIQAGLKIAESHLGAMLSVIRLGYLLTLLMTPFADVFGRRRLLLYTVMGYTVFTGAECDRAGRADLRHVPDCRARVRGRRSRGRDGDSGGGS